jgi:hypothetical protein
MPIDGISCIFRPILAQSTKSMPIHSFSYQFLPNPSKSTTTTTSYQYLSGRIGHIAPNPTVIAGPIGLAILSQYSYSAKSISTSIYPSYSYQFLQILTNPHRTTIPSHLSLRKECQYNSYLHSNSRTL